MDNLQWKYSRFGEYEIKVNLEQFWNYIVDLEH